MRIRTIKPSFYKNEKLAELPLSARMLFVGLWGLADREGRLEYRPKYIKAEIFPYDDFNIVELLNALSDAGFIFVYGAEDLQFIQVVNFSKHQRINGKEASEKSDIPPPPERRKQRSKREAMGKQSGSNCEAVGITGKEGKGREGNTEGKGIAAKTTAASLPAERRSSPPHVEFVEKFAQTYQANTGQPYRASQKDFVISSGLIKAHGLNSCVEKAVILAGLCDTKSAWFTKDGWASYTIGKLSSQWNSIIAEARQLSPDEELKAEIRKQEEMRERANALVK